MVKDSGPRSKKFLIWLLVIAGVALVWWYTKTPTSTTPQNDTSKPAFEILMRSGSFEPNELTVNQGDAVTFKNVDSISHWPASNLHPTHGIYPEFDPQQAVASGDEWRFVFDKIGSWKYHDHLLPTIRGTVHVK